MTLYFSICFTEFIPTIILQPSGVMQAMVGEMQDIICSLAIAFGTDTSEVKLTWVGPDGVIIEDDRVFIIPTFADGNTYTTILQFDHLMEGDEGVYTCDVMIGENIESLSVELQNIISKYMITINLLICSTTEFITAVS